MDIERNLGEQPIAKLMRELELSSALLVRASSQQLNHKMVSRATKGRRLTANVMNKVREAINAASGRQFAMTDLFNYTPTNAPTGDAESSGEQ